jgi:uncharacterized protein YndB with AHSA1/START domain
MVTLLIEHPITDYGTWSTAFGRFADRRRAGGVQAERIYQPVDDPSRVVITLDFAETSQAVAFLEFLTTQVWRNAAMSPALDGTPRTAILQRRETPL